MASFRFGLGSGGKSKQIEFLTGGDFAPDPRGRAASAKMPDRAADLLGPRQASAGVMPYLFSVVMAFCAVGVAHWLAVQVLLSQPPMVDERALAGMVETAVTRATNRLGLEMLAAQLQQVRREVDQVAGELRGGEQAQAGMIGASIRPAAPLPGQLDATAQALPLAPAPPVIETPQPYLVNQDIFYRVGPSMSDRYLGKLSRGERVIVARAVGDWLHFVRSNGEEGFVRREWVQPDPEPAPAPVVATAVGGLALDAGGDPLPPAPAQALEQPAPPVAMPPQPPTATAEAPVEPAAVQPPPAAAMAAEPAVTTAAAGGESLSVVGDVNLRAGPGVDHPVVGVLRQGILVESLDSARGWRHVRLDDGRMGWVSGRWLEPAASRP